MDNISAWNARIDKSLTVTRLGRNGVLYDYILPYGANPSRYYEEAIDVKSRKGFSKYSNGKRPGQYQPVGDKRYFTFYQINKMRDNGDWNKFHEDLLRRHDEAMLRKWEDAVVRGVIDGV